MKDYVADKWSKELAAGGDYLLFGSGEVIVFDSDRIIDDIYHISPICDTNVCCLEKYDSDLWVGVYVLSNKESFNNKQYFGGEGSWGNDGFLACTDMNGGLDWVLYSRVSNPFYNVKILDKKSILATTSSDLEYLIEIENPANIKITYVKDAYEKVSKT